MRRDDKTANDSSISQAPEATFRQLLLRLISNPGPAIVDNPYFQPVVQKVAHHNASQISQDVISSSALPSETF